MKKPFVCFKNDRDRRFILQKYYGIEYNIKFDKTLENKLYTNLNRLFFFRNRMITGARSLEFIKSNVWVNSTCSAFKMYGEYVTPSSLRGTRSMTMRNNLFPHKTAKYILDKYNVNDKFYDFSIGWGDRAVISLLNGIEYFGTDPSERNWEIYHEMLDYLQIRENIETEYHLYKQGSETFIPELENKMGLCFSSPPYFTLEKYEQENPANSTTKFPEYRQWSEFFLKQTVKNCSKYLIPGGYFVCNIKNFGKYKLEEDLAKYAEECGLQFVCIDEMFQDVKTRINGGSKTVETKEKVFVYKKKE